MQNQENGGQMPDADNPFLQMFQAMFKPPTEEQLKEIEATHKCSLARERDDTIWIYKVDEFLAFCDRHMEDKNIHDEHRSKPILITAVALTIILSITKANNAPALNKMMDLLKQVGDQVHQDEKAGFEINDLITSLVSDIKACSKPA